MKIRDLATHREHAALLERLCSARVNAGLSQADLARKIGIERSMVSKYETGRRRLDMLELARILKALYVDPGTFFAPDAEAVRPAPAPRRLRLVPPPRPAAPRSGRRRTRGRASDR